jgi:Ni/Co efflux regulator RcnB
VSEKPSIGPQLIEGLTQLKDILEVDKEFGSDPVLLAQEVCRLRLVQEELAELCRQYHPGRAIAHALTDMHESGSDGVVEWNRYRDEDRARRERQIERILDKGPAARSGKAPRLEMRNGEVINLLNLPPEDFMVESLKRNGWSSWYSGNYWVHPKRIKDRKVQDYTNYGLPTPAAYVCMIERWPPAEPNPLSRQQCPEGSILRRLMVDWEY